VAALLRQSHAACMLPRPFQTGLRHEPHAAAPRGPREPHAAAAGRASSRASPCQSITSERAVGAGISIREPSETSREAVPPPARSGLRAKVRRARLVDRFSDRNARSRRTSAPSWAEHCRDRDVSSGESARRLPVAAALRRAALRGHPSRCSRKNSRVRGHASSAARRFAPSRSSCARRKPCPAPA